MSNDDTRRRIEYQAVGGALAQLDTKNPHAAQLIAGLTRVIIDEADKSSRFAAALVGVIDGECQAVVSQFPILLCYAVGWWCRLMATRCCGRLTVGGWWKR
ncbi:hypothetical protein ABLE94_15420, partial [Gordonia sp. VNK1]